MMASAEIRGFVATLLVLGAIAFSYSQISKVGDDDQADTVTTTTTSTTSTTTTILTDADLQLMLCRSAREASADLANVVFDANVVSNVMSVLAGFYDRAVALTTGDVRAEFLAAQDFYSEYRELGEPLGYDVKRFFEDGDWRRWEILNTTEPTGVNLTRFLIFQDCDVELPPPPAIDQEIFDDLKKEFDLAPQPQAEDITVITQPPTE